MVDVIILGAGASGSLASIYASKSGKSVLLLERNNCALKKIYATGNGRCNYLNENAKHFDYLYSELKGLGIIGVTEDEGRLYPRSKESTSIIKQIENALRRSSVDVLYDCHITDLVKTKDGFKLLSKDGRKFECKKLLIACGGKAGIQYGCYGEGYRFAMQLLHHIVKPVPALVPMECEENIEDLHGVRVKADLSLFKNDELINNEKGELQFTKDSISGIAAMNLSKYIRLSEEDKYILSIDFFKDYSYEELIDLLNSQYKICDSYLLGLLPLKLCSYIEKKGNYEIDKIARLCKDFRFNIKGTKGWSDAQVTSGGIVRSELFDDFQSRLVDGLYFAGEIIDYDGPCGGYNLAFAFYSGIRAGISIGKD